MFSPANKATACGMWSPIYICALALTLLAVAAGLWHSRKMGERGIRRVLMVAAVLSIASEIGKMLFVGITYGPEEVEWTPLYFCSCYMYALVMALCRHKALQTTGLTFLFYGGIIGALCFFAYPSACIPRYPIYHYMCLRTMLFHGSMLYVGILIVMRGYYRPSAKHFKYFAAMLGTVGLLAYGLNRLTGKNYMYISKPLSIPVFKAVFAAIPQLYPFLGILLQMTAPFWLVEGIRRLVRQNRKEEALYVHN